MAKKFIEFIKDRRTLFIMIIVIVVSLITGVSLLLLQDDTPPKSIPVTTTTQKNAELFKGYRRYDLTDDDPLYDVEKMYEFTYADSSKKSFSLSNSSGEFVYEVSRESGTLTFSEQQYKDDADLLSLEYTGNVYTSDISHDITDFLIAQECDTPNFSLYMIDKNNRVYGYEYYGDTLEITEFIAEIRRYNTISSVKEIGYYTLNNTPSVTCSGGVPIYVDSSNNVRYLSGKNELFFADAYFKFIGADYRDQLVYVLNDGTMQFAVGNTDSKLYDGNNHIKYRGSFYSLNDDESENLYILGTDNYLYEIVNLSEESGVLLNKVRDKKVTSIGSQIITSSDDFATDQYRVIVLFEDDESINFSQVYNFEVLS